MAVRFIIFLIIKNLGLILIIYSIGYKYYLYIIVGIWLILGKKLLGLLILYTLKVFSGVISRQ